MKIRRFNLNHYALVDQQILLFSAWMDNNSYPFMDKELLEKCLYLLWQSSVRNAIYSIIYSTHIFNNILPTICRHNAAFQIKSCWGVWKMHVGFRSGLGVVLVVMLKEGSANRNAAVAFISCVTFKHQHWQ